MTTRRSVRRFNGTGVSKQVLQEIIDLAANSPSAGDARPWSFVIVDQIELLEQAVRINPYATAAETAPCGIVVCGELQREKFPGFWVQDCAACSYALLLAAHAKGLGANWTGIYPIRERVDAYRRLLHLPDSVIPFSLILLGYSERRPGEPVLRDEMRNTHYNAYGTVRPSSLPVPSKPAPSHDTTRRSTLRR